MLVHGEKGLDLARKTTDVLYSKSPATLTNLSQQDMKGIFEQAPYVRLNFEPGLCLIDFAMKVGCFRTDRDAQRIIAAGGFYINEVRHENVEEVVVPGIHILANKTTLVRVGKKNYYIVEWLL